MKKQSGISAIKLILCVAIGILTAGFIGSVISYGVGVAFIKGIVNEFNVQTPQTQVLKPSMATFNRNQFYQPLPQQPMQHYYAPQRAIEQQVIENNPSQNFIEYKGKRTYYGQVNKSTQNKPTFTGNQFVDKTVSQSQQVIQDMGKDMIKNTEKVQKQAMANYQNQMKQINRNSATVEYKPVNTDHLTREDVINHRKITR